MTLAERDGDVVKIHSSYAERTVVRQLPGASHKGANIWQVPLTWAACVTLRGLFGKSLEVGPKLAEWSWQEFNERIKPALDLREAMELPSGSPLAGILDIIESDGSGLKLNIYQRADAAFLVTARQALLANPPGLGKTPVTIRATQILNLLGESVFPVIIICPNSLKISVWAEEIARWAPEWTVSVVNGNATSRRKQLAEDASVFIINWEAARLHSRLAPYGTVSLSPVERELKELNKLGAGTVIMDEAHRLAHPNNSRQARAAWAVAHQAEFRFALTGTPITDTAGDLWGLLHGISPKSFPAKTRYIDRYCTPPDSPVLMADGTFCPVGSVRAGDKVLAFTKERLPAQFGWRSGTPLVEATILAVNKRRAPIVSVKMESGVEFKCTPDHQWLDARKYQIHEKDQRGAFARIVCGMKASSANMTRHLRKNPDHSIVTPERSIPPELKPYSHLPRYGSNRIFGTPEVGRALVKVVDIPSQLTPEQQDGRSALTKFIHYCRPVKAFAMLSGSRCKGRSTLSGRGRGRFSHDQIISVEECEESDVVSLTTTTGTYVVHGYASSNCEISLNLWGGMEIMGLNPATAEEFRTITNPFWRRIPKKAALPYLPGKLPVQYRLTPMTASQARLYHQMEEEMISQLDDGEIITASGQLPKLTRLMQFAAASAKVNEAGEVDLVNPSCKINDLVELLEEMGSEPLVVAAVSRKLIELAASKLKDLGISYGLITGAQSVGERAQAVSSFQNGNIRVILLTIGAGSEGITLTRASTLCFMQRSWRPLENEQTEGRIDRIGAEHHDFIRIIEQITPNTVEERKKLLLSEKESRIEEVVRDKDTLRRLLGG